MQNWEARILAREHEVGDKEADLVRQAATAADLRAGLAAMKELVGRQYRTPEGADDLQAIEGIGPKIANLLHNADIRTFERLSETSLGELTRILEAGGSRFGLADPLTWAEQASCLVNGDYVAFEQLKEELIGGVRRDAALLQEAAQAAAEASDASGTSHATHGAADQPDAANEPGKTAEAASDGPLFEAMRQGGAAQADETSETNDSGDSPVEPGTVTKTTGPD